MRSSFLQSPQVLVVEASAGSGKTSALAKRYVQLCLHLADAQSLPLQSILAITFTNKAAWEMKSRILDFLKRIALKKLKPYEVQDILKPLGLDDERASKLAFGLMNDVIRQYHYFQVQTIDSFVNVLLAGCSFKIGLSSRFKIQRNSKEYLQLSLDELLDRAEGEVELRRLFEDFVRQYLFLENRSGWFPRKDLLEVITELFKQYNIFQKPLLIYPCTEDHASLKGKIFAAMKELREICPPQTNKRFLEHINSLLADGNGLFDVDDLGTYWSKEEFPINKGGVINKQATGLWRRLKEQIQELCRLESRSMFNPYVALFERSLVLFGQLSQRDDVLFLEELNRKAALLFEDELVSVEELYFRLAARLQHYLIDEFQDTSLSQWRNLSLMVEEALSHGGSLFYVGDKKQAIYAFRGGESRLFDALQRQLVRFNVQTLTLDKNYRSCPEIIAFNNRVFSLDNLRDFLGRRLIDARERKGSEVHFSEEDFEQIANTFRHAKQMAREDLEGGAVRVFSLEGRVKQERAEELRQRLIPMVRDIARRFTLRDIAILTRGNDEVEEITQWLLQEGIHASSERSSDIKNNPLVGEVISLLSFLNSPVDNDAFAQFCLGALMPKATGIAPQVLRDFLFDCARKAKQVKGLYFYQCFREAFPQVWKDFFEDLYHQAGISPLYELTAGIVKRFNGEGLFPQYQGFLMHLLELVKKEELESCDLSHFLEYYEALEGQERFVPMADVDAVQVLTVHKAKGLQFPVVIVPYLEMDINVGSGGRDGGRAYVLDIRDEGVSLIRLKETYRQFCPELQQTYEQEYKKAFLVELNSVYVALTRAVEELYIFVPSRVNNAVNPARFLVPQDNLSKGEPSQGPVAHHPKQAGKKIKAFVADPWEGLEEELFKEPASSAALAQRGEFYHALLSHVGHVQEQGLDAMLYQAWEQACRLYPSPEAQEKIVEDMRHFINRDDVRRFFYLSEGTQVYCEKEFVNKYGDTRRIDRLIVLKDEAWVVDYKFSSGPQAQYQKQIEEYVELVKQFYPKHKVSGHILYLMKE